MGKFYLRKSRLPRMLGQDYNMEVRWCGVRTPPPQQKKVTILLERLQDGGDIDHAGDIDSGRL